MHTHEFWGDKTALCLVGEDDPLGLDLKSKEPLKPMEHPSGLKILLNSK